MADRSYRFETNWRFDAPTERIWDEIMHPERWPEWWRAVESVVELKAGDDEGLGSVRRYTWRGALPYRLSFDMRTTRINRYSVIEGEATGELSGRGCWNFSTQGPATVVRYDWEVDATKQWMRILSPVARPIFEWNHDIVMRWGFEGLTKICR